MRFLPGNAQHIGARSSQQDSFGFADPEDAAFISHGGFLAIVCDGMGGMEHGDAASRTAVRAFLEAYAQKLAGESIPAALERSVHAANDQVVGLARTLGMVEGIGTTLVATALRDTSFFYISVGDSGIFHASGGLVQSINHPHVFANLLDLAVARGQMTREAAMAHPERESLTSFIGAERLEEIDQNTEPWPLKDGDTVLLASDGMFKTLEPDEIADCLRGNPPSWPDALVAEVLAKRREYQDNVTVLSVTVESEARAASPRTVRLAPSPAVAVAPVSGINAVAPPELPRTVMLPVEPRPPSSLSSSPLASSPPLPPPALPPTLQPPLPAAMAVPSALPPLVAAPSSPAGRGPGWWIAALLVLAAAGAGWWFWTHRAPAAEPKPQGGSGSAVSAPPRTAGTPLPEPSPIVIQTAPNGTPAVEPPPNTQPLPEPQLPDAKGKNPNGKDKEIQR